MAQNQALVDQLRKERDNLLKGQTDLQARYTRVTDVSDYIHIPYSALVNSTCLTLLQQAEAVRRRLAESQSAHDERRHQLELRVTEIENLRHALFEQASLFTAQEAERKALETHQAEVAQTIVTLEADLLRVRKEAETIKRDVVELKEEREGLRRRKDEEADTARREKEKVRKLYEQVVALREMCRKYEEAEISHVCAVYISSILKVLSVSTDATRCL